MLQRSLARMLRDAFAAGVVAGGVVGLAVGEAAPATAAPATAAPATAAPLDLLSPAPTVSRTVDPAIAARAKEWLHRLAIADIDRSQLTGRTNDLLTDKVVRSVSAQLRPLGDPVTFRFVGERVIPGNVAYIFLATFKSKTLDWVFTLDEANLISGLRLVPVQ